MPALFHVEHNPDVSRETRTRLTAYADLLTTWNRRINLISPGDLTHLWTRHIADSLQLIPFLPPGTSAIDVGSGAGFPGLILSIATGRPFTLIESDARKAAFLREAARVTEAPATILNTRIENAAIQAPLITARALAPLPRLLDLCVSRLLPGGTLLFLKGAQAEAEIEQARLQWTMRVEQHISVTGGGGVILRISEVARA